MKLPPRREAEAMQAIDRYLRWRPDVRLFWRQNSGVAKDERGHLIRYGLKGISDFLGAWGPHGTLLAIEVKGDAGRLTKEQKRFLDSVNAANGLGFMARTVEEVQSTLDREWAKRQLGDRAIARSAYDGKHEPLPQL
jgi:hypothetical protein